MKKLSVILVAFVLLFGTSISTAAVVTEKESDKVSTSQEIASLLQNSEIESEEDIRANVIFTVNTKGEIVVLTVDTDNEIVERFIKSRLNYEHLENALTPGKEYKVPVRLTA